MDRILLVEDDEKLGAQVVRTLEEAGFDPTWIQDGDEARLVQPGAFSLLILDLMLPGTYGLDLLKIYRKTSDVPILILSARNESADKVRSLSLGADDYVVKPFWPDELVARVKARLRRPRIQHNDVFVLGSLSLDSESRCATFEGISLELTRVEFDILLALTRRSGNAVTRKSLVNAALDPERMGTERTLDVHISRLRKKLAGVDVEIKTVWGIGYRIEPS